MQIRLHYVIRISKMVSETNGVMIFTPRRLRSTTSRSMAKRQTLIFQPYVLNYGKKYKTRHLFENPRQSCTSGRRWNKKKSKMNQSVFQTLCLSIEKYTTRAVASLGRVRIGHPLDLPIIYFSKKQWWIFCYRKLCTLVVSTFDTQ